MGSGGMKPVNEIPEKSLSRSGARTAPGSKRAISSCSLDPSGARAGWRPGGAGNSGMEWFGAFGRNVVGWAGKSAKEVVFTTWPALEVPCAGPPWAWAIRGAEQSPDRVSVTREIFRTFAVFSMSVSRVLKAYGRCLPKWAGGKPAGRL